MRGTDDWFAQSQVGRLDVSEEEKAARLQLFTDQIDTRELIHPRMARLDKQDVWRYLVNELAAQAKEDGKTPLSPEELEKQIPKFLVYDMYNKHFTPKKEMKISKPDEDSQWLYDFIKDLNTFYTKPITEENMLNSTIFTQEMMYQLLQFIEQHNQDGDSGEGMGNSQLQKAMENAGAGGKEELQQRMQQAADQAQEKVQQLQDMKDNVVPDDEGGDSAGKSGSDLTLEDGINMKEYYEQLKHVNFNSGTMANFFKDTLKMSTTYFSGRYTEEEEGLFDADDLDDLLGLENLLPQLRKVALQDVVTHKRKYHLKFDVYVDTSGSMGYGANSRLMLAKVTALRLNKLGLVDKFYGFDTSITKPLKGINFLRLRQGGGTSIQRVIDQITEKQRPSVIITDCQDVVHTYEPKAYVIGVKGANFYYFGGNEETQEYFRQGQLVQMQDNGTLKKVGLKDA